MENVMIGSEIIFKEFENKMKYISLGRLSSDELMQITSYFEKHFRNPKSKKTTEAQTRCLIKLIRYSGNMLNYIALTEKTKEQKIKAEYLVMQKGRLCEKAKSALNILEINVKTTKKNRKMRIKELYEKLLDMKHDYTDQNGVMFIDYQISKENLIFWVSDAEKRMSIVNYIKHEFYGNNVTSNAVIQELHRLKTKNLPPIKSNRTS